MAAPGLDKLAAIGAVIRPAAFHEGFLLALPSVLGAVVVPVLDSIDAREKRLAGAGGLEILRGGVVAVVLVAPFPNVALTGLVGFLDDEIAIHDHALRGVDADAGCHRAHHAPRQSSDERA